VIRTHGQTTGSKTGYEQKSVSGDDGDRSGGGFRRGRSFEPPSEPQSGTKYVLGEIRIEGKVHDR